MQYTDNAKIGEFKHPVHDPHNIGQYIRLGTETGHQQGHVRRTLMVGNDQRSRVSGLAW